MQEIPQPDLDRIWQESEAHHDPIGFYQAIVGKGIIVPADSHVN